MAGANAKGDLFQNVLVMVVRKWGKEGLETIGRSTNDYKPEEWYPFPDLCEMLNDIDGRLGTGDNTVPRDIGYEMMKSDFRWRTIFTGRDPSYVFLTNKRQETQFRGGYSNASSVGGIHIRIEMGDWLCGPAWYEFYKGRLKAVLELTGHSGSVEMTSDGERYIYDIIWQ